MHTTDGLAALERAKQPPSQEDSASPERVNGDAHKAAIEALAEEIYAHFECEAPPLAETIVSTRDAALACGFRNPVSFKKAAKDAAEAGLDVVPDRRKFPQAVLLSANKLGWLSSEIRACQMWLRAMRDARQGLDRQLADGVPPCDAPAAALQVWLEKRTRA